jgi:hypothetical protein
MKDPVSIFGCWRGFQFAGGLAAMTLRRYSPYKKPDALFSCAFKLRDLAIDKPDFHIAALDGPARGLPGLLV